MERSIIELDKLSKPVLGVYEEILFKHINVMFGI